MLKINAKMRAYLFVEYAMTAIKSEASAKFRTHENQDSRHFNTWYSNEDTQRIIWAMYRDLFQDQSISDTKKSDFLAPYVFFDGLDSFSFDRLMDFCRRSLLNSGKRYFPIIIKPEIGSAHYMAAILRKDDRDSVTLFLFNPLGFDRGKQKKIQARLGLTSIDVVGGMRVALSPHALQTLEKDDDILVSCGPLSIEFIHYALRHPEWIDNLDHNFDLDASLLAYGNDTKEAYQSRVVETRRRHDHLLESVPDELLATIDGFYGYMSNRIMEMSEIFQTSYRKDSSQGDRTFDCFLTLQILLAEDQYPQPVMSFNVPKITSIDRHLDILKSKIGQINQHHFPEALSKAKELLRSLQDARNHYHLALSTSGGSRAAERVFKQRCDKAIDGAKPILERDLGWGAYLTNLLKKLVNVFIWGLSCGQVHTFFTLEKAASLVAVEQIALGLNI